ncbi:MAG: TonB-dependent receptor [Ignavibacteriales bacterium]|nr:TonB-dependent receptor [Ignavibacteriales bacterium]
MNSVRCRTLLVALFSLVVSASLLAQSGKITGVAKDATSGDPIVGANVIIEGTTLGGAADGNGVYFILNVPPGTYRLVASAVGYARQTVTNVGVSADQTVTQDFSLQSEAIGLEEIVVEARQRIVDKSLTGTKTVLGRDEVSNTLPVTSAVEILNTTPGAYKGFIRGGRIQESKTIVDGVDISDAYYAPAGDQTVTSVFLVYTSTPRYKGSELNSTGGLNFSSIEQLNVNTGAVGAEYSTATAGVINYTLKEGRGPLSGSFFARASQFKGLEYKGPNVYWNDAIYFAERDLLSRRVDSLRTLRAGGAPPAQYSTLAADSARLGRYTYSLGKYNNQDSPQIELEGSVGGDIMPDWNFFLSGRYFDSNGRLPNEKTRELNITGKTNYQLTNDMRISAFSIITDRGYFLKWKNRSYQESARYFLEGVPKSDGGDVIASAKLTHVLSPSTFYEVQASINSSINRVGYIDSNGDGKIELDEDDGTFLTLSSLAEANKYISNTDLSKFFRNQDEPASSTNFQFNAGNTTVRLARPGFYYENFSSQVIALKGDITSQVTHNHQLKGGFQIRLHDLDMVRRSSYLGAIDARKQFYNEEWNITPSEYGIYVADRMEFAGLIINLGARLDIWDPAAQDFGNYFAPYKTDSTAFGGINVLDRVTVRTREVDPVVSFSPRFGVSHPISDEAAMYFSFSRNTLPPPYSRMFGFYNNFGNISLPNVSSIRQEPYRSSNYELGVQWEFMPQRFGLNFTAYLRDIENYGFSYFNVVPSGAGGTGTNYNIGFSAGLADARGVEVSLQALPQRYFDLVTVVGRLNYAYTYIKESQFAGLDQKMQTSFSTANGDSARLAGDLPFEDINFYNKVFVNVQGTNSTLTGGYDRTHRITYTLLLTFPEDIRLTSIGTFQSGFFYPLTLVDPRVSSRELGEAPWNKMVNLRLEKGFTFSGLRAAVFIDVKNVFDWENILGYDRTTTGTSKWETSLAAGEPDPTGDRKRSVGPDGTLFYDIPREFYFGVRVEF